MAGPAWCANSTPLRQMLFDQNVADCSSELVTTRYINRSAMAIYCCEERGQSLAGATPGRLPAYTSRTPIPLLQPPATLVDPFTSLFLVPQSDSNRHCADFKDGSAAFCDQRE